MENIRQDRVWYEALNVEDDDDEEVPITEQLKTPPPPPPPPPAPEVIEIVEDEEEVEETVIESTETDQEEIVDIEDIEVEDDFEDVDVPFAEIGLYRFIRVAKRYQSHNEELASKSKSTNTYAKISVTQRLHKKWEFKDVYVQFVIAKDGSITSVRMRGPDKNLGKEAARIISRLPKMTPGKQRGRAVRVPFSIPITFRLQ